MGGAAPVETGKKGKKSLDNEMNLVPFIDLLSCLISFLLITAVWTQISSVPARSTGNLQMEPPPPDPNDHTIPIRVTLTDKGYTVTIPTETKDFPKTTTNGTLSYDTKSLVSYLTDIKAKVAQAGSEQQGVTMAAEDTVAFEDIATTMDSIIGPDPKNPLLPQINIMPATN